MCSPLPAGDCADPVVATHGLVFTGTSLQSWGDEYTFNGSGCTSTGTTGRPDLTFRVDLQPGQTVRAVETGSVDALIHLQVGSCGSNSCAQSTDSDTVGVSYTAMTAESVFVHLEPWGATSTSAFTMEFQIFQCGDGVVGGTEACDDGNMMAGDGCSPTCTVEPGFICAGNPSTCGPEANWGQIALAGCSGTIVTTAAMGVPAAIPDGNSTGVTLNIPVSATGTVQGTALRFNATHTWVGDVGIYLRNPAGAPSTTGLDVSSGNGSSGDNYTNTIFADAAAVAITAGTAPFTGLFRPEQPFSVFNGTPASGTWTLRVTDSVSTDTGTVTSAELAICVVP
jgi:cysteine-rich repeat protein